MTTLRVLLVATPAPELVSPWALYDADGRVFRSGRDAPGAWPAAERVEAVVAASQVRIATVALPPVPAARLAAAAAYALEDQLAGPADAQLLAVSAQRTDGRVRVAIATRTLVAAVAAWRRGERFARVVAEPDLAPPLAGWRWCGEDNRGFVRGPDGSAFAANPPRAGAALPAELTLALAAAARTDTRAPAVRVDADVADADLARWQSHSGAVFVRGTPWRWHAASPREFAAAIDLLQGELAVVPVRPRGGRLRLFRVATILVGIALALHVVATVGEWVSLKVDGWRDAKAWTELASAAGLPAAKLESPVAMRAALMRRHAELRHAQGLPAPDDALPLLARAAPALGSLPAGAVRSAVYADGHWTLDLVRADDATIHAFDARMRDAGVSALTATTAAGTRVRFGAL